LPHTDSRCPLIPFIGVFPFRRAAPAPTPEDSLLQVLPPCALHVPDVFTGAFQQLSGSFSDVPKWNRTSHDSCPPCKNKRSGASNVGFPRIYRFSRIRHSFLTKLRNARATLRSRGLSFRTYGPFFIGLRGRVLMQTPFRCGRRKCFPGLSSQKSIFPASPAASRGLFSADGGCDAVVAHFLDVMEVRFHVCEEGLKFRTRAKSFK